jgi:hypothetical protein
MEFSPKQKFFVYHMFEGDYENAPTGTRFVIQVLDTVGVAIDHGFLPPDNTELEITGRKVPVAVIKAAWRQIKGKGDYVDINGNSVPPG